ncbi:MAG: phage portal protein [Vicinamibacterales bacterium]
MAKLAAVSPRAEVSRGAGFGEDFYYVPDGWVSSLAMAGVGMSPELALTLSHVHCAVDTISADFGTMTCQMFKDNGDDGKTRVKFSDPGIGGLAYRLRWQPNAVQTAKAFWSTMAWQYLLRPQCYAEILYRPGSDSIVDQLLPRHPDRVEQQRLPSGRVTYKLTEPNGGSRFVTQDEMFTVRNTSTDGLNAISRTQYGHQALGTALKLQQFTKAYFQKGATAALIATYKGQEGMTEEEEAAYHGRISRFIAGAENAGGLFLTDEDLDIKSLGVEPEKAQLLGLKDLSGRDVARLFKMPPHKLGIAGTQTYASQVQSAQEYVAGTQMPMVVEFEQAIYIHLIVARDYYAKFNMDYLLRASFKERMEGYEIGIRARVLRPSEARVREDMNPDEELDRLSAMDHRPGSSGGEQSRPARRTDDDEQRADTGGARGQVRATLVIHDNALRVLRREREAVKKLAKRHEHDAEAWRDGLREFYADHAKFTGDTLRLPMAVARAVAAQHGALLEDQGLPAMDDHWERLEAEELTALALAPDPSIYLFEGARP